MKRNYTTSCSNNTLTLHATCFKGKSNVSITRVSLQLYLVRRMESERTKNIRAFYHYCRKNIIFSHFYLLNYLLCLFFYFWRVTTFNQVNFDSISLIFPSIQPFIYLKISRLFPNRQKRGKK